LLSPSAQRPLNEEARLPMPPEPPVQKKTPQPSTPRPAGSFFKSEIAITIAVALFIFALATALAVAILYS
jgi:hypothetical protein